VVSRARNQEGFGLIELLMAMTMLNIGILALVAAFQSGAFALQRASKISTAAAIADIQMERFRAITYTAIALDGNALTGAGGAQSDPTYTSASEPAYPGAGNQLTQTCSGSPLPNECLPIRTLIGPDGKRYRLDTYIINDSVASARLLKRVTLVVRDANKLSARPLARIASTFDQATGS
jgi:type II secretory pathway pseudopilin PulG